MSAFPLVFLLQPEVISHRRRSQSIVIQKLHSRLARIQDLNGHHDLHMGATQACLNGAPHREYETSVFSPIFLYRKLVSSAMPTGFSSCRDADNFNDGISGYRF